MRIVILADDFPPYSKGGAGISSSELAGAFQKKGHEVFVITTTQEKNLSGEENLAGLKISRIYSKYSSRWRAYLSLRNPKTVRSVEKLLREIKPDIVHCNNIHYYLSYFCLKLARKYARRVFLTARDTMLFSYGKLATKRYLEGLNGRVSFFDQIRQAKKRYNPFRNTIIRHYLKYVDKVFAISYSLGSALEQNGIKNVEVVYNGINVADWQIDDQKVAQFKEKYGLERKKVVFFAGRAGILKGEEQLNQAMTRVQKEIPEAHLLTVGQNGIGWLSGKELIAAYHAADLIVTPSVYLDPFNRTNIEGMACRKPVVGTCFGGTPEIVQDGVTGFIVNPFDTSLMAEKIAELLKNPQKAQSFGEAGYNLVREKFNLEKQAEKYLKSFAA